MSQDAKTMLAKGDEKLVWQKMPRVPCSKCGYTGRLMNFAGYCARCWTQAPAIDRAAMRGRDVQIVEQVVREIETKTEVRVETVDNSTHRVETIIKPSPNRTQIIAFSIIAGACAGFLGAMAASWFF